ncbi:MAG: TonB-dependent receptor [Pseudomonadota bacterium]
MRIGQALAWPLAGALLVLVAILPALKPAHAVEASAQLEEVVVRAQRREQNLKEVPVSVTAFSGETIERTNIRGSTDYLARTPNVSFTEDGQAGSRGLGISIRGINNLVSGENAFINSVGIYLDEFSIASVPNQVANPFLPDMASVEVLRGPQGTYFGRNSLGGALNLTTRDPVDSVEGNVRVDSRQFTGAGDAHTLTGMLNVPLGERFKARGVVMYEDSTGRVRNINESGTDDSGHQWLMGRIKAIWEPGDATLVKFTLLHSDEQQGHDENVPSGVLDLDTADSFGISDALDPGTGFWPDNRSLLSHDLDERNDLRSTVFVANVEHRLSDELVLKAIGGIVDAEQQRFFDNDLIGGLDALYRDNDYDGQSWSTELRLEKTGERFDWVAGFLSARDRQQQSNNVAVSTDPSGEFNGVSLLPPFPQDLGLLKNAKDFRVESNALFGDLTWHVTDSLDLFAGGRYTRDRVSNSLAANGIAPGPDAPNPADDPAGFFASFINYERPASNAQSSFSNFSPRVGVKWQMNDQVTLFTTVSQGYKAGGNSVGNNTNAAGEPAFSLAFDEETLWNYEAGIKSEWFDRRLQVNASVFRLEWSDLQLEAFRFLTPGDLSSNFEQTINVESARAQGLELEVQGRPTANLTLGGALGLLDTEITSASTAEITGGFVVDLQGRPLPKAPELTWNVFGEYRWSMPGGDYWVRAEAIHRDGQYSDVEGLTVLQTQGPSPNAGVVRNLPYGEFPFRSPDYNLVNLRAGLDRERFSIGVYAENLLDEEYYTGTQENFGASGIRLKPNPRVVGASLQVRF